MRRCSTVGNSARKGTRRERELANELDDRGFAVIRAPASGAATTRELPDVFAGNGNDLYAIEAKASSGDPIYVDSEELDALAAFALGFNAKRRIAVRFDREEWAFFHPRNLHRTDAGNRRIKVEDLPSGDSLDDL